MDVHRLLYVESVTDHGVIYTSDEELGTFEPKQHGLEPLSVQYVDVSTILHHFLDKATSVVNPTRRPSQTLIPPVVDTSRYE